MKTASPLEVTGDDFKTSLPSSSCTVNPDRTVSVTSLTPLALASSNTKTCTSTSGAQEGPPNPGSHRHSPVVTLQVPWPLHFVGGQWKAHWLSAVPMKSVSQVQLPV